ncbi:MAG: hypothetical protein ACOX4Z_03330 [Desulfobulbus sp.]|jgi:phage regulator Rha-like protein
MSSHKPGATDLALTVQDGKVTASSRDIAKTFKKHHRNVVRAIEELDCPSEFKLLNF